MGDDFNIKVRPLYLLDYVELDLDITKAYAAIDKVPPDIKAELVPILEAACDYACVIASQLGINPNEAQPEHYIRIIFK